jgi:GNAT superfamily N-acetyltransferase
MSSLLKHNTGIVIREAMATDADIVSSLLASAFHEYKEQYTTEAYSATVIDPKEVLLRMSQGPVWVAFVGDNAAGTVSLVLRDDAVYIRGMAVSPAFKGLRVGERLMSAIEDFAYSNGCVKLILSTTPFLARAIHRYEKFGFVRTDDGPHHLFGTPLFSMAKILDADD